MPLTHFICPDNERIKVCDCLKEGGCRLKNRCATRSYLMVAGADRPWKGKPSTTQLISGTMHSFLKIKHEYATRPDSRTFMILGTRAHKTLEDAGIDDEYSMLETALTQGDVSGITDGVENENEIPILFDRKTTGSYKVAKALGIYIDKEPIEGEFWKSGKHKGEQKTRSIAKYDPAKSETEDWNWQLNKYRIEIKKQFGIDCKRLKIEAFVRDGGTYIARSRGIFGNLYYFDIPILPDEVVNEYFERKKNCLLQAVKQGYWNDICTDKENWDGIRCARFCDVAEYCPFGVYLKEQREKELFMPIKGLSEPRKIPRLGKIRLGTKVPNAGGNGEHPKEVDYFILDPDTEIPTEREKYISEFARLYGEQPKSIDVMLPTSNMGMNLVLDYKRYSSNNLLRCKGDGETATCKEKKYADGLKIIGGTEEGLIKVECLGEDCPNYISKKCARVGVLNVLLQKLPGIGVWQIVTHSIISIQNIIDTTAINLELFKRIHMLPATLERREVKVEFEGKANPHYPLFLDFKGSLADVQRLAQGDPTSVMLELPQPKPDEVTQALAEEIKGDSAGIVEEPQKPPKEEKPFRAMTHAQAKAITGQFELLKKDKGWDNDKLAELLINKIEKTSMKGISYDEAEIVLTALCVANKPSAGAKQ